MNTVSDASSCGITYDRHSDNSVGVIYNRSIFVIHAPTVSRPNGFRRNEMEPTLKVRIYMKRKKLVCKVETFSSEKNTKKHSA